LLLFQTVTLPASLFIMYHTCMVDIAAVVLTELGKPVRQLSQLLLCVHQLCSEHVM